MPQYGVDVHDGYQAGLSFPTLKRQGYSFAAVKLTQGTDYARDKGDDWVRAARDAALVPGGYHWLNSADGAAQARWFYRKVKESGGPDGMLIQLDAEDNGYAAPMRAWAAEWEQLSGGHPWLMYSGAWWWNDPNRPMRTVRGVDLTPYLWHSHYITADADTIPDDPAAFAARLPASYWNPGYGGWTLATFIQLTSKGDAGGLVNNVDLSVYLGSMAGLLALTRRSGAPPKEDDMTTRVFFVGKEMWVSAGEHRRMIPNGQALNDIYKELGAVPPVALGQPGSFDYATWPTSRLDECFGPPDASDQAGPAGGLTEADARAVAREEIAGTTLTPPST